MQFEATHDLSNGGYFPKGRFCFARINEGNCLFGVAGLTCNLYQFINFYHLGGDPSSCSARVCDWLASAHSHLTCAKWCKKNGG